MGAPYGTVFVAWGERAVRDDWYGRSSIVSSEQRDVLERVLDATVRRGYVVTLSSDSYDHLVEVMRAISAERTIRDVRRILAEHLTHLPPVAYLVDDEKAGEKLLVESLQAPIFDSSGEARYALTVTDVDLELEPEALAW